MLINILFSVNSLLSITFFMPLRDIAPPLPVAVLLINFVLSIVIIPLDSIAPPSLPA